jgi:hypothetical protein
MKITKSELKEMIQEEVNQISELSRREARQKKEKERRSIPPPFIRSLKTHQDQQDADDKKAKFDASAKGKKQRAKSLANKILDILDHMDEYNSVGGLGAWMGPNQKTHGEKLAMLLSQILIEIGDDEGKATAVVKKIDAIKMPTNEYGSAFFAATDRLQASNASSGRYLSGQFEKLHKSHLLGGNGAEKKVSEAFGKLLIRINGATDAKKTKTLVLKDLQAALKIAKKKSAKAKLKEMIQEEVNQISETMNKRQGAEVIAQLGGSRFIAMTGAKDFFLGPKGMVFKIGRNSNGINYVRISLNFMDTYDIQFLQVRKFKEKVKSEAKGVYADMIRDVFEQHTGLRTSL